MGMPTTLNGMIGFIVFIIFIVAIAAPGTTSNENTIIEAQNNMRNQLNNSVNASSTPAPTGFWSLIGNALGLNGIYDIIIGILQIALSFLIMVGVYITAAVSVFVSVPAPFFVMFLILASGLIIGVLKLVLLNGD